MENENGRKNIKGVKIQTLNYVMIVAAFLVYAIVLIETFKMQVQYDDLLLATDNYIACESYAVQFSEGSDYLSDKVRLYVINGNKEYAQAYFQELDYTKRRESALDAVVSYGVSEDAQAEMEHAMEKANRLMEREIYAMRLAAEGRGIPLDELDERVRSVTLTETDAALSATEKLLEAQERVFGSVYQNEKQAINVFVGKFINRQVSAINQKKQECAEDLKNTLKRQILFISVLFIMNVVIFIFIIRLIIRPLKIYMNCIRDGEMLKIAGAYEFKYLALTYNSIYEINYANEQMLKHKAEHDALTGLVNRGAFVQFAELYSHNDTGIALLIIDVDKFKQINDTYGHTTGDSVLQRIAKLLKVHFRSTDCVARVGGDEFSVIMVDMPPSARDNIARKITSINDLLQNPDDGLPAVSISAGVAFSSGGYTEELYKQADTALYYVKENGRCGYAFYEESMPIKSRS